MKRLIADCLTSRVWLSSGFSSACSFLVRSVLCTVHSVRCTLYTVHCTLYSVQCTLYSVYCTLYTVHCTLYMVQCAVLEVFLPCTSGGTKQWGIVSTRYTAWHSFTNTLYTTLTKLHNAFCTLHTLNWTLQYVHYTTHYSLNTTHLQCHGLISGAKSVSRLWLIVTLLYSTLL